MSDQQELIMSAYKKLKSSVFFDKTQLILRDKIVFFEQNHNNLDNYLQELLIEFLDDDLWIKRKNQILDSIKYSVFPKKTKNTYGIDSKIITNTSSDKIIATDFQYFIDMDVEGHIFSVLWLLLIGKQLDKKVYEHSYGNRLKIDLEKELDNTNISFSPYLFEPYFELYESWRDNGLKYALNSLEKKQDIVIITLDLKKYYYSVDFSKESFEGLLSEDIVSNYFENINLKKIHDFVFDVIKIYSGRIGNEIAEKRLILPIGFLPSNVLGNVYLENFDKAISDGWNPLYYGRYVDDIIIVDKIEKNSSIYLKSKTFELTNDLILDFYLTQNSRWHGFIEDSEEESKNALLKSDKKLKSYILNSCYNLSPEDNSKIKIQNDKVKVFHFSSGDSTALINCFRSNILKNKSEFRFMPEDESIFQNDDYNEIFILQESDTLNKFHGIDGVGIDKFALSKYLGKISRIGGLVNDKKESKFEKDIIRIFNNREIIDNYTMWEKVIQILVVNERYDTLIKFVKKITLTIEKLTIGKDDNEAGLTAEIEKVQNSLMRVLRSAIAKSFSIVWGDKVKKTIENISNSIIDLCNENYDMLIANFSIEYMNISRTHYCLTRMCDKYLIPGPIDAFINKNKLQLNDSDEFNLTNFSLWLTHLNSKQIFFTDYKYYPYIISIHDFSIYNQLNLMLAQDENKFEKECIQIKESYIKVNFNPIKRISHIKINDNNLNSLNENVEVQEITSVGIIATKVGNEIQEKLKVAIANVSVSEKNLELVIKGIPDRSYKRYEELANVINQALTEKADILVVPESYVPFEWLPLIARTCAKNQFAVITGVEHIKIKGRVYNYTATILPFTDNGFKSANISFHLKNHYSPKENEDIVSYNLDPVKGDKYHLYYWKDCWFSVYCCYELASINDRSLFQSFNDILFAVEWNRDVNYFSNILESLSRDIHCYCVQVNSSNFGDSRITRPSRTEEKDMIRSKGGINNTILVDNIDFAQLRDFQFKGYEKQKNSNLFKVTPPNFKKRIVEMKMNRNLWENLKNQFPK